MGWPAAYRRASVYVAERRGFQTSSNARRALSQRARINARTALKEFVPAEAPVELVQASEAAIETAADIALSAAELGLFGGYGRALATLIDLYRMLNQEPLQYSDQAQSLKVPSGWTACYAPCGIPTKWGGAQVGCAGNCHDVGFWGGNVYDLPADGTGYARISFAKHYDPWGPQWAEAVGLYLTNGTGGKAYVDSGKHYYEFGRDLGRQPLPVVPPSLDPWQTPIELPAPEYPPVPYKLAPYRRMNPWRSPSEQTQRGPIIRLVPPVEIIPGLAPSRAGEPGPTFVIESTQRPNERPRVRPGQKKLPRPPAKNTKEKKTVVRVEGAVAHFIGTLTEVNDWVTAIWQALPKSRRSKGKTHMQTKLWDIWFNFEYLDVPVAVQNLITNELQDRWFATVGKLAKEGKQYAWNSGYFTGFGGPQLGGRYRGGLPSKYAKQTQGWIDISGLGGHWTVRDALDYIGY